MVKPCLACLIMINDDQYYAVFIQDKHILLFCVPCLIKSRKRQQF